MPDYSSAAESLLRQAFPYGATVSLDGGGRFVSLRYWTTNIGPGADGPVDVYLVRDPGDTTQTVPMSALEHAALTGHLELDHGRVRRPVPEDMHLLSQPLVDFVGNQSSSDGHGSFKERMRLHQSWWRTFRLCLPPGVGPGSLSEVPRGNMLRAEDGRRGLNFCSPEAHAAFEGRTDVNQPGLNRWATAHNLMASQAMAINVFGHLRHHRQLAGPFFAELLGEGSLRPVEGIDIERTSDAIADRTAFDAYVTRRDGDCLAIETKLTEPFSQQAYNWDWYARQPAARTGRWNTDDAEVLGDPRWSQLWRNHLLAIAECERSHSGAVEHRPRLLVVHHPEDRACLRCVEGYRETLIDPSEVIAVDLARVVELLHPLVLGDTRHERWLRRIEDRYLRFDLSESLTKLTP